MRITKISQRHSCSKSAIRELTPLYKASVETTADGYSRWRDRCPSAFTRSSLPANLHWKSALCGHVGPFRFFGNRCSLLELVRISNSLPDVGPCGFSCGMGPGRRSSRCDDQTEAIGCYRSGVMWRSRSHREKRRGSPKQFLGLPWGRREK